MKVKVARIAALLIMSLALFGQDVVIRGQFLQKHPPPLPTVGTSEWYGVESSQMWTVWTVVNPGPPRATRIFVRRNLAGSPFQLFGTVPGSTAELAVGNNQFSLVTTFPTGPSLREKVWLADFATRQLQELLKRGDLVTARIQSPGLPPIDLAMSVDPTYAPISALYPGDFIFLPLTTSSGRYPGIYRRGDNKYTQVTRDLAQTALGGAIWHTLALDSLYYRQTEGGDPNSSGNDRLVRFSLQSKVSSIIFDGRSGAFGEPVGSLWNAAADPERTKFYVWYGSRPLVLPWPLNPRDRLVEVDVNGAISRIWTDQNPIGEFGRIVSVSSVAAAQTFAVVAFQTSPPFPPLDGYASHLAVWDGQTLVPLMKAGDSLAGKQVAKMGSLVASFATYGCNVEIPVYSTDNSLDLYILQRPCILQAPQAAQAGSTVTLQGLNFQAGQPAKVEVLLNGLSVQPDSVANDRVIFTLPANLNGNVRVTVRLTYQNGATISNAVTIAVFAPPVPLPQITKVVHGASFLEVPLAPQTFFTVIGLELGSRATASSLEQFELGGARVAVCGISAPLIYNSGPDLTGGERRWQLNGLMPAVPVGRECQAIATVDGRPSAPFAVAVARSSWALFEFTAPAPIRDGVPIGPNLRLPAATLPSGEVIGPEGYGLTPARVGGVVVVYGTGCTEKDPPPVVKVEWREVEVLYAGPSPGQPGLCQINFVLPDDLGAGEVRLDLPAPAPTYTLWVK